MISSIKALRFMLLGTAVSFAVQSAAYAEQPAPSLGAAPDNTDARDAHPAGLADIIVTARRRSENLQTTPVAVTVLSQAAFEAAGSFSPQDLNSKAPGLAVASQPSTGSRNSVVFNIRGQGSTFGTLFPSVITYFAEVPTTEFGQGQFFDLENIQVLRGPQGVQFGRVTNGGNIMVAPRKPSNEFEGEFSVRGGNYDLIGSQGAINIPVVDDKIMIRAAYDAAQREGYTKNIFDGRRVDGLKYVTGRLGILIKPFEGVENYSVVQYQRTNDSGTSFHTSDASDAGVLNFLGKVYPLISPTPFIPGAIPAYSLNANGTPVPFDPALPALTIGSYLAAIKADVATNKALAPYKVNAAMRLFDKRKTLYFANTTTIDVTDNVQVKNIFGYTNVRIVNGGSYNGGTSHYIWPCHAACPFGEGLPNVATQQVSNELRVSGEFFDKALSVSVGGYADRQSPDGRSVNHVISFGILDRADTQNVVTKSKAIYGYAEYDFKNIFPGFKINGGLRYTEDKVRSENLTATRFIPSPTLEASLNSTLPFILPTFGQDPALAPILANIMANVPSLPEGVCVNFSGGIFSASCTTTSAKFHATTYSAGASYEWGRNFAYVNVRKGYRPGGVNPATPAGFPQFATYSPETDYSIELGLKSQWTLGNWRARTNIALFRDRYKNIQQTTAVPSLAGSFPAILNVAEAALKGVEVEAELVPTEGLRLGLTYSYIDAKFDKDIPTDPTACSRTAPVVIGFCPLNDFAYTPKHQFTVSANYSYPLAGDSGDLTFGVDYYRQSTIALYANNYLSPGLNEPAYGIMNLNVGWNNIFGKPIDAMFFMTNVLDEVYRTGSGSQVYAGSIGLQDDIYGTPRMFGLSVKYRFGANAE